MDSSHRHSLQELSARDKWEPYYMSTFYSFIYSFYIENTLIFKKFIFSEAVKYIFQSCWPFGFVESQSDILSDNHITYLNAAFHPFPGAGWLRVTWNEYWLGGIYTPWILTGYILGSMKVTHWIALCFSQYCPMCSSSPLFREHYLIENQISASECQPWGSPMSLPFHMPWRLVFDTNKFHL